MMAKVAGGPGALTSREASPRSPLEWKDWGYESAGLEPTEAEPLVGVSPTRSESLAGLSTSDYSDGPLTPPLHLGRRLFRSPSPPLRPDRQARESNLIPESPSAGDSEGPTVPAPEQPPTQTLEASQLDRDEQDRRPDPSELWETVWGQDQPSEVSAPFPFSRPRSCTSAERDDEISVCAFGDDMWSIELSGSSAAVTASGQQGTSSNRTEFMSSLNEELASIRTCVKRAIGLGKKVQHYGTLEVSDLQGQKANAEVSVQQAVQLNLELEQQVSTLREEVQKLQWERELEVMAMNNEIQELEMERNTLIKAMRDEKKKREKLQNEVDSVLSVLLEEKMKLEAERETHDSALRNEKKKLERERETRDSALRNEKKKLHAMRKARDAAVQALEDGNKKLEFERDAAVQALEDGNKKLEFERDATLMAMRDLTSRLDFERDTKLRSMRRTSMDMATMMSPFRLGGRKNSIGRNDDALSPRPASRQNSRQFQ